MTTFTAANYLNNSARTEAEMKQAFEDNLAATKQLLGAPTGNSVLTLASDQITPTGSIHRVDTQGGAGSDDLAAIVQTNLPDFSFLWLGIADASRNVVVKHNAGGSGTILLANGADFTIDLMTTFLILQRVGTTWEERGRFFGTDTAAHRAYYATAGLAQNTFTGRQEWKQGADIASASTVILGTDGNAFIVAGTTTINGLSTTPSGTLIYLGFPNALQLTYSASLLLAGAVSRRTVAGEWVTFMSRGGGVYAEIGFSGWGPRILQSAFSGAQVNASQGEAALYGFTVPAGTMGTQRRLRLSAVARIIWLPNAGDLVDLKLYFGGQLLSTVRVTDVGSATATAYLDAEIGNMANVAIQVGCMRVQAGLFAGASPVTLGGIAGGVTTANTAGDVVLQLNALWATGSSSAAILISFDHFTLELL